MAVKEPSGWYVDLVKQNINVEVWPLDDPNVALALSEAWGAAANDLRTGAQNLSATIGPIVSSWGDALGQRYQDNARTYPPNYDILAGSFDELKKIAAEYADAILQARDAIMSELVLGALQSLPWLFFPGGWAKVALRAAQSAKKILKIMERLGEIGKGLGAAPKLVLGTVREAAGEAGDEAAAELLDQGFDMARGTQDGVNWDRVAKAGATGAVSVPLGKGLKAVTNTGGALARKLGAGPIPDNAWARTFRSAAHNTVISPAAGHFVEHGPTLQGLDDSYKQGAVTSAAIGGMRAGMSEMTQAGSQRLLGSPADTNVEDATGTNPPNAPPSAASPGPGTGGSGAGPGDPGPVVPGEGGAGRGPGGDLAGNQGGAPAGAPAAGPAGSPSGGAPSGAQSGGVPDPGASPGGASSGGGSASGSSPGGASAPGAGSGDVSSGAPSSGGGSASADPGGHAGSDGGRGDSGSVDGSSSDGDSSTSDEPDADSWDPNRSTSDTPEYGQEHHEGGAAQSGPGDNGASPPSGPDDSSNQSGAATDSDTNNAGTTGGGGVTAAGAAAGAHGGGGPTNTTVPGAPGVASGGTASSAPPSGSTSAGTPPGGKTPTTTANTEARGPRLAESSGSVAQPDSPDAATPGDPTTEASTTPAEPAADVTVAGPAAAAVAPAAAAAAGDTPTGNADQQARTAPARTRIGPPSPGNGNNPPPPDPPGPGTQSPDPNDENEFDVDAQPQAAPRSLGRLDESRVTRDPATGLITEVDNVPVAEGFGRIARHRAELHRAAQAERAELRRSRTGNVLAVVLNLRTGEVFESTNGPKERYWTDPAVMQPLDVSEKDLRVRSSAVHVGEQHRDALDMDAVDQQAIDEAARDYLDELAASQEGSPTVADDSYVDGVDRDLQDEIRARAEELSPELANAAHDVTALHKAMERAAAAYRREWQLFQLPGFDMPLRHAEVKAANAALLADEDSTTAELIADVWDLGDIDKRDEQGNKVKENGRNVKLPGPHRKEFCPNCSGILSNVLSNSGPPEHNERIMAERDAAKPTDPPDTDDSGDDASGGVPLPGPDTPTSPSGGTAATPETAPDGSEVDLSGQDAGTSAIDAGGATTDGQSAETSSNPTDPAVPTPTHSNGAAARMPGFEASSALEPQPEQVHKKIHKLVHRVLRAAGVDSIELRGDRYEVTTRAPVEGGATRTVSFHVELVVGVTQDSSPAEFQVTGPGSALVRVSPHIPLDDTTIKRALAHEISELSQVFLGNASPDLLVGEAPGHRTDTSGHDHGRQAELRVLDEDFTATSPARVVRRARLRHHMRLVAEELHVHPTKDHSQQLKRVLTPDVEATVDKHFPIGSRPSWHARLNPEPDGLPSYERFLGTAILTAMLPGWGAAAVIATAGENPVLGAAIVLSSAATAVGNGLVGRWYAGVSKAAGDAAMAYQAKEEAYQAALRIKALLDPLLAIARGNAFADPAHAPAEPPPNGEKPTGIPELWQRLAARLPALLGPLVATPLVLVGPYPGPVDPSAPPGTPPPQIELSGRTLVGFWVAALALVGGAPMVEWWLRGKQVADDLALLARQRTPLLEQEAEFVKGLVADLYTIMAWIDTIDGIRSQPPVITAPSPDPPSDYGGGARAVHFGVNVSPGGAEHVLKAFVDIIGKLHGMEALQTGGVAATRSVTVLLIGALEKWFHRNELKVVERLVEYELAIDHAFSQEQRHQLVKDLLARILPEIHAATQNRGAPNRPGNAAARRRAVNAANAEAPATPAVPAVAPEPTPVPTRPPDAPGPRRHPSMSFYLGFGALRNAAGFGVFVGIAQAANTWTDVAIPGFAVVAVGVASAIGTAGWVVRWMNRKAEQEAGDAKDAQDRAAAREKSAEAQGPRLDYIVNALLREIAVEERDTAHPTPDPAFEPAAPPSMTPTYLDATHPWFTEYVRTMVRLELMALNKEPRPYLLFDARLRGLTRLAEELRVIDELRRHAETTGDRRGHDQAVQDLEHTWFFYQRLVATTEDMPDPGLSPRKLAEERAKTVEQAGIEHVLPLGRAPSSPGALLPSMADALAASQVTPGGRSFYPADDAASHGRAQAANPREDYYTVHVAAGGRGVRVGDRWFSVAQLATLLRHDPNWRKQAIWVTDDHTGLTTEQLAELGRELGVEVRGDNTALADLFAQSRATRGGRAYYSADHPHSHAAAQRAPGILRHHVVHAVASPTGVWFADRPLSIAEFAAVLRHDPDWRGQDLWVTDFITGLTTAQRDELAALLGVTVRSDNTHLADAMAASRAVPGGRVFGPVVPGVPGDPAVHTIHVHADDDGVVVGDQRFSVAELAMLIRQDPGWDGRPVRIDGGTGLSRASLQELANLLGVPVHG